ncbi:NADP-dependent oxidoreductase [Enterococcus sp. DIV0876]|uniref:NADP-dependent oxidoreductase n=1 Tax=Enterococcus sp. DIV0876 TaxID=2774633 RepID=UPI003D300FA9
MDINAHAIGFDHYGSPDVFEERDRLLKLNSENNVLIKIERAGINPVDTMYRDGSMSGGRPLRLFQVLGSEVSGIIEKLYRPVSGLSVGDQVIVKPGRGGYSDYLAVNDSAVHKIPDGMSLDEAAAFPSTAVTAYWGLNGGFFEMKEGETIAIVGASGSVGSYLVQLAKPLNVTIIAVASKKNEAFLKELGATIFIDYNDKEQVEKYARTADYVLDASLFNSGEKTALSLVKENGIYIGMTTLPDHIIRPDVTMKFLSRTPQMNDNAALSYLIDFYKKYGLNINIAYKLPFTVDGVKKAHQLIKEKRNSGKIILSRDTTESSH